MLALTTPEVFQVSVEDSPAEMVAGLASKERITGPSEVLMVIGPPVHPSQPAVNTSTSSRSKGTNFFMLHLQ
jgi:hypothetical protein